MPHAFLPRLKTGTGNAFLAPQAPGVWEDRETQLIHLAEGIEIPSDPPRIYSIPDPWARPLLFDRALYDPKHKLHEVVLGEWRGLLAMIGLRERRVFDSLTVRPVMLTANRPNSFASVLTELLQSLPVEQAGRLGVQDIVNVVKKLNPEQNHAAHLAVDVLRAALAKL